MDFDLTDEQAELQETVRRFCESRFPIAVARRWGERDGFDRTAWAQLAALGVFELAAYGHEGDAGAVIDGALAYEVLGGSLVPGPVLAASLASGLIDGVAEGAVIPALIERDDPVMLATHLGDADIVLVLGRDRVARVEPSAVGATRVDDPLDPTASVWLVDSVPDGDTLGEEATARRLRLVANILISSMLLGISATATQRAADYAKQRWQFGRPIGSFQAVKHLLADCFARTEVARAAVYAAAVTADDPRIGDSVRAASGARYLATDAATSNAKAGLQVFGGLGFTWEMDAHLYVKRAWTLRSVMGSVESALDAVAARL